MCLIIFQYIKNTFTNFSIGSFNHPQYCGNTYKVVFHNIVVTMKINLGCGKNIIKGYTNIDKMNISGVDIICDIEKERLPLDDDSCSEFIISHVLEHIFDLEKLLKEVYRVSQNGCKIKINTPYFSHESAFSNYQHIRRFTWTTFDLFNPEHPEHFHSNLNFKIIKKELRGRFLKNKTVFNLMPRLYQEYLCWIFPTKEIYYELGVIK